MTLQKYEKMKDSGIEWIGEIPKHWRKTRLGYECQLINGYAYSEKEFTDSGYPIIRIQNLNGKKNFLYSNLKLPEKQFVQKGDLLFVWSAIFGPFIWEGPKASYHYHQWKVVPKEKLDKKFMFYNLDKISDVVKSMSHSGIDMVHMTKLSMEKLPIFLPDIDEQLQIRNYLDLKTKTIDDEIFKNKKLIELLKEQKQSIINRAVIKGLDDTIPMKDSGVKWIGKIPKHWNVIKLKYLVKLTSGFSFSSNDFVNSGIPVLKIFNVSDQKIDWSEKSFLPNNFWKKFPEFHVYKNDLLIAMTRPIISFGLKLSFFKDDFKCLLNQRVGKFIIKKSIRPNFLFYLLCSKYVRENISIQLFETVQPNISSDDVERIPIALPPILEQEKISNFLDIKTDKINLLISKVESQISKLQEFRESLISSTVTGKICVTN
jgi:type I restriction enzyme, S subunit